jgi:tRNA(Ile)-lysidine synthase
VASAETDPIGDREAVTLLAPLRGAEGVALAVSGGADSTALMHLWARARDLDASLPSAVVMSVDHRLRSESAAEVAGVAAEARSLGLEHRILVWEGDKPTGDLEAAARRARHRLIGAAMSELGLDTLVLAHHADDQAETFLIRLARGSGVVGLSGMAATAVVGGIRIVRPLLAVPKARLRATLVAAGIGWVEDPSNGDQRFERARFRAAMPKLAEIGLGRDRLTATARAMARASAAIERLTDEFARRAISGHPLGWTRIDLEHWGRAPEEVRLRVLSRAIARIGGADYGPRLGELERLDVVLGGGGVGVRTLGRVRIECRRAAIWLAPEAGRQSQEASIGPGESLIRSGLRIGHDRSAEGPVSVGLLGRTGREEIGREGIETVIGTLGREGRPSAAILEAVVAVRRQGHLVAVPALGWRAAGAASAQVHVSVPASGW